MALDPLIKVNGLPEQYLPVSNLFASARAYQIIFKALKRLCSEGILTMQQRPFKGYDSTFLTLTEMGKDKSRTCPPAGRVLAGKQELLIYS